MAIKTKLLFIVSLLLLGCSKSEEPQKSSDKSILSFGFKAQDNVGLTNDVSGTITGSTISVSVPGTCDLSSMKASFTVSPSAIVKVGQSVQIDRQSVNNFSTPVTYSVFAEDGSSASYSVSVTKILSSQKELLTFVFEKSKNPSLDYDLVCNIDNQLKKIWYEFPSDIQKSSLVATFTVSDKATLKINNSSAISGTTSASYTQNMTIDVVAEDGSLSTYLFDIRNEQLPVVDITQAGNKIRGLNLERKSFYFNKSNFVMPEVVPILTSTFKSSKPSSAFPFDCGYIGNDGKIYVSRPVTADQKELFKDINTAVQFYACKAFIRNYFSGGSLPIWLENGFAAFESGAAIDDNLIKSAINSYGSQIPHFSDLNDRTSFIAKKGIMVAYLFGEFFGAYFQWPYFDILSVSSDNIGFAEWRFGTASELYEHWKRYAQHRTSLPENTRLKWINESTNFRFLTREADAINFPLFPNTFEEAYAQYKSQLKSSYPVKLTVFTVPEAIVCEIDGSQNGGRITGGTAWVSGLALTCSATSADLVRFPSFIRHELGHAFAATLIKEGVSLPAWLNEGIASYMADQTNGHMTAQTKAAYKPDAAKSLNDATLYFGHKPTFEDIAVYPNPYFNYYLLGQIMYEFIYDKGGFNAVIEVTKDPLAGIQFMGYSSTASFMSAYYDYFDANWR